MNEARSRASWVLAGVTACLLSLACGQGDTAAPTPQAAPPASPPAAPQAQAPPPAAPQAAPSAATASEAEGIFASRCTTCHGPRGAGDGPASAGLTPPPRNFQDPEWQRSITDAQIEQIIQYGGAAVGKSPAMPSNPDLMSKPEVVAALRQHVRSLAR